MLASRKRARQAATRGADYTKVARRLTGRQIRTVALPSRIPPGFFQTRYNHMGMASKYGAIYPGEKKYIDQYPATNAAGAGADQFVLNTGLIMNWWSPQVAVAAAQSLVQIPQGTTKNTRIGNKCRIKAIRMKLLFKIAGNTIGNDTLRCIIYQDRQCNGTPATVADILELGDMNSFQAMDFVDQIKILYDKKYVLDANTSTALNTSAIQINLPVDISMKMNHEIHFNNTTGALAGIVSNNFNMLLINENPNTTVIQGTVANGAASVCRVYFTDQ